MHGMEAPQPRYGMLQPVEAIQAQVCEGDREEALGPERSRLDPVSEPRRTSGPGGINPREHAQQHREQEQTVHQPREHVGRPSPAKRGLSGVQPGEPLERNEDRRRYEQRLHGPDKQRCQHAGS